MLRRLTTALFVGLLLTTPVAAQAVFHTTPDWISADTPVSTGGALVDLNHDGWLDFVVSNGNDMAQEHVAVYYNQGDGTYPSTPNWQSADSVYNGHLDVADVNGDGWDDVAVATLGNGTVTGPIARVYLNNLGTLSSTPSWTANVNGSAFGVAFGDMNNDGRPDLAVATGWAYGTPHRYHNYVYVNTGSGLEATASWVSDDTWDTQGACWVDADDDGWLDLVLAAGNTSSRAYRNLGGTLETTASWSVGDVASQDAIMVTAGDVTADGRRDLFMADNNQLAGGSGRFRQYQGVAGGLFETTASWVTTGNYCSAVALADVDCDGDLDLTVGSWWGKVRIYYNASDHLSTIPAWSSGPANVVEKICFGDIDKNGLRPAEEVYAPATGQRLFYLPYQPIQTVTEVAVDGVPLATSQYHVCRDLGWVTIGVDPVAEVVVQYTVSSKLDMAVTYWDDNVGNYVYYNQRVVLGDANCDGKLDFADINPFVWLLVGGYENLFPDCDGQTFGDMNGDGVADFGDINGFVDALVN